MVSHCLNSILVAQQIFFVKMVANDTVITLKGSVEIVSEFFFTAINSILYQRGKFLLWM